MIVRWRRIVTLPIGDNRNVVLGQEVAGRRGDDAFFADQYLVRASRQGILDVAHRHYLSARDIDALRFVLQFPTSDSGKAHYDWTSMVSTIREQYASTGTGSGQNGLAASRPSVNATI